METDDPDVIVEQLLDAGYEFKSTGYRWTIILLFALNFFGRAIAQVGFVACARIIQGMFGVNPIHTTLLVLPFSFSILVLLFPYGKIANTFGLVIPTRAAVIALVIGAWVRYFVTSGFGWLIVGQCIIAIGSPLSLIAPAKIASIWFPDNQRALATMIGSLATPLGSVVGFVIPFIFIQDEDGVDTPEAHAKFKKYILWQNIIIIILSLPIFFFVKNRPLIAPSVSELKDRYTKKGNDTVEIKQLVTTKNYMLYVFTFAAIHITFICFGAVMGQLVSVFGFRATDNQYFGISYILFGMVGSFAHASMLDKHKKFRKQIWVIIITNIVAGIILVATINIGNVVITSLVVGIVGIGHLPNIGVGYQFVTEIVYPVGDNLSIGVLQLICCFLGICYTFLTATFVKMGWKWIAVLSLIIPPFFSAVLFYFVKEDLKKHRESIRFSEARSSMLDSQSDLDG
uniref:Major facilitator superfamily (MFS) profile domain-containing protein n=1 Tax=Euplotes crassus TaxID=5936 RepID=A0A7S3K8U5_EUPCR